MSDSAKFKSVFIAFSVLDYAVDLGTLVILFDRFVATLTNLVWRNSGRSL